MSTGSRKRGLNTLREAAAKDPKLLADLNAIMNELMRNLIFDALKEGMLKLHGKTKEEASKQIVRHLRKAARRGVKLITDKRPSLLQMAEEFANDKPEFAAVFLATYFEHWLNDLIFAACVRKRVRLEIAHRLIRNTPFNEKAGSLLEELDMLRPPKAVSSAIGAVSKIRNDFIHYRWEARDGDEERRRDKEMRATLKRGFQAVTALGKYERDTFLKGLDDLAKHSREDSPNMPADYWDPYWITAVSARK